MPPCPRRRCWWSRFRCCWAQPAVWLRSAPTHVGGHAPSDLESRPRGHAPAPDGIDRLTGLDLRDWHRAEGRRCRPGHRSGERVRAIPSTPASVTVDADAPAARARFNLSWPALIGAVLGRRRGHPDRVVRARSSVRRCARERRQGPGVEPPARRVRARHGRSKRGPLASKPRAVDADDVRHPAAVDPDPRDCRDVDGDRRRAVILHELAHIARRDCLTQTLAFVACALLVPSGRVVGHAAVADRTGARVRRPRDRGGHAAP